MISGSSRNMILSKIRRRAIKWCKFRFAIDSGRWVGGNLRSFLSFGYAWYLMSIFSDYFSLSSTNLYINSKLFLRLCVLEALWCFNRVRGPLVTAPDLLLYVQYVLCFKTFLFCVQYIQQQSRLASQLYMHLVTALRVDYPGGYLHPAPCTVHPPG